MDKFQSLENDIIKTISNSYAATDLAHARSTKRWLLKLKPDADKGLQVAAIAHDIERGMPQNHNTLSYDDIRSWFEEKRIHSIRSAEVISELLERHGFDESFIKRVDYLVRNHEFGGDADADVLRDADSISFFEQNLKYHLKEFGKEMTIHKIAFMFSRMSDRAKGIVRELMPPDSLSLLKESVGDSGLGH